jgi:hypothetical protein
MIYFALLLLIFPSSMRVPFVVDVESKFVTLSARPVQGDTVTAVFEVIPKEAKENLKIIFYGFEGTKPTTADTVFPYDAQMGEKSTFSIDIVYLSTPALFKAKVTNSKGRPNGLDVYRYMVDAKTKEYGTRKEIQIQRPIEYRFNTGKRYFEREILRFENDRWTKNRAIIDSIQKLDEKIPDSLALVLYEDIPKVIYPKRINSLLEKAEYLLQEGWSGDLSESDRKVLIEGLNQRILEEEQRVAREKERHRNKESFLKCLFWIIPVIGLLMILVPLFRFRKRFFLRSITPTAFDRIVRYAIYLFVIGAAIYFAYPYLPLNKKYKGKEQLREIKRIERENWEAVENILRLDELKIYSDYPLVNKSPVGTRFGVAAHLKYKDVSHSRLNIEYHFLVKVYPTKEGTFKIIDADYNLEEIIRNIEKNDQFAAFVTKLHVKKVNLERRAEELLVSISDTIAKGGEQYPISLRFDNTRGVITNFSVPAYFTNPLFPELDMLRKRCENAGYAVRHDKCIKYKYRGPRKPKGYATLVNNGGTDTLWMWFSPNRPEDIGYRWIPVPRSESPPAEIIGQLYYEFEKAGLPDAYIREHLQIVSSSGMRQPDYFKDTGDKAILEARIKWNTGQEWIDECNKGEGIRFAVSYEYFARSKELGKILGKPNRLGRGRWRSISQKRYFLKPITQLISEEEAREKLFSKLPEDKAFSSIYIEIHIPEEKENLRNFIYLVGVYNPSPGVRGSIKVNLETGEILQSSTYDVIYT